MIPFPSISTNSAVASCYSASAWMFHSISGGENTNQSAKPAFPGVGWQKKRVSDEDFPLMQSMETANRRSWTPSHWKRQQGTWAQQTSGHSFLKFLQPARLSEQIGGTNDQRLENNMKKHQKITLKIGCTHTHTLSLSHVFCWLVNLSLKATNKLRDMSQKLWDLVSWL